MAVPTESELGSKLDALIRLTALQVVGDKSQTDAIKALGKSGLETSVIAEVVGTTPGTVRSTLARVRKSRTPRRSSRKKR